MRDLPAVAAWILAVLLVAATLAAGSAQAQDRPLSDATITKRVELVLAKAPFLDVEVETRGAVVNLKGVARSLEDIAKAGELARGVSGVSGVTNGLRVADRPSRA